MTERTQRVALSTLSGLLIASSLPLTAGPASLWPLAWLALTPLLWALRDLEPRAAFGYGLVAGWVSSVGILWWLADTLVSFTQVWLPLAWLILAVYALFRGLQLALFSWLYVRLGRRRALSVFAVAALFVVTEHFFPAILPTPLGASQHNALTALQVVELAGISAVSFVLVAVSATAYRLIAAWRDKTKVDWRQIAGAGLLVAATLTFGAVRLSSVESDISEARTVRVGIVQPNIGVFSKEAKHLSGMEQVRLLQSNILKLQASSAELEADGAELIVWSETAFIAFGNKYGKTNEHFAAAITTKGRLALWSDTGERFSWRLWEGDAPQPFKAVSAAREDAACAVGADGAAACWDGRGLAEVEVDGTPDLNAVAVVRTSGERARRPGVPLTLWAVGDEGALLRGDLTRLEPMPSGTTQHLRGIVMAKPGQGLVVGDGGTLITLYEDRVLATTSLGPEDLHAVFVAPDAGGAWLGGQGGAAFQITDEGWARAATDTQATLRGFAGMSSLQVWAVGDSGTVLRQTSPSRTWERVDGPDATADFVAASVDARGALMVAARDGRVWIRQSDRWSAVPLPAGAEGLVSLTWLPFSSYGYVPRDVRYLSQSTTPLPATLDPRDDTGLFDAQRNVVQRGFRTPVVFGAVTHPGAVDGYNSAVGLDADGRLAGVSDKSVLLPIAETLPTGLVYGLGMDGMHDLSADLYEFIPEASHFAAASEPAVIELAGARIGVMICYEDILSGPNLALADSNPNLLVNLTNDAWFGRTSEPWQHLALSTIRAVELRRSLVRATQTGLSAVILPTGEIAAQTALDVADTLLVPTPLMEGETLYGHIGDLFVYLCLLALLILGWRTRRPPPA